jgi:hypothetical protein
MKPRLPAAASLLSSVVVVVNLASKALAWFEQQACSQKRSTRLHQLMKYGVTGAAGGKGT